MFIGDRNGGRFWLVHSRNPGEAWLRTTELHFPPPLSVKHFTNVLFHTIVGKFMALNWMADIFVGFFFGGGG